MNLETKRDTKRIKIHQSQWPFGPVGVNCFLRGLLRWLTAGKNTSTVKVQKAPSLQILIYVAEKSKDVFDIAGRVLFETAVRTHGHLLTIPMRVLPLLSPLKQSSSFWYTYFALILRIWWRKIQSERQGEHDNRLSSSHPAPVTYLFQNKAMFVLKIMQIFKEPLLSGPKVAA